MAGQTEIMFDGGVPMLDGTWYNPKTGDAITIRDTLFEDNNLIVVTTDGRRIPYTQMEKYIKSDKPIPKMPKVDPTVKKNSKQTNKIPEPATWDDLILDDDKDLLSTPLTSQGTNKEVRTTYLSDPKEVLNHNIMDRALNKWNNTLKMTVLLDWGIPKENLKTLIDMFGLTPEDIAKYVIAQAKEIDITEAVKDTIALMLKD